MASDNPCSSVLIHPRDTKMLKHLGEDRRARDPNQTEGCCCMELHTIRMVDSSDLRDRPRPMSLALESPTKAGQEGRCGRHDPNYSNTHPWERCRSCKHSGGQRTNEWKSRRCAMHRSDT